MNAEAKIKLKRRIIEEMTISDHDLWAWSLAKEIYKENESILKPSVTIETIFNRIKELRLTHQL